MKFTVITAVVDPLSFSLENSLSWQLTSDLQRKKTFELIEPDTKVKASLIGCLPILQPLRAKFGEKSTFVVFMRSVFESSETLSMSHALPLALTNSAGVRVADMLACRNTPKGNFAAILMAPPMSLAVQSTINPVRDYVTEVVSTLWDGEPINWTTHALQLASTGQFLSGKEIIASSLTTGVLISNEQTTFIGNGVKPMTVAYRKWKGAGTTSLVPNVSAQAGSGSSSQGSACTFGGQCSDGGDWGTGDDDDEVGNSASGGDGGGGFSGGGGSGGFDGGGGCGGDVSAPYPGKVTPSC